MNGGIIVSFDCLLKQKNGPSALRSTVHLGRYFRVTNVPSPLTFSMLGVQRRESEHSHLRSEAPKRVMCSEAISCEGHG